MKEKITADEAGGFVEGESRIEQADQYRKIFDQNPKDLKQFCTQANIYELDGYKIDDLLDKLFEDRHFANKNGVEYSSLLIGKLVDAHIENLKEIDSLEKGE